MQQAEALLLVRVGERETVAPAQEDPLESAASTPTDPRGWAFRPPIASQPALPPAPCGDLITITAEVHQRPAVPPVRKTEPPIPACQKKVRPAQQSVATMTEARSDLSPSPQLQQENRESSPWSAAPTSERDAHLTTSLRQPRVRRTYQGTHHQDQGFILSHSSTC